MRDRKMKKCKKCGEKTEHILRGFGSPGSFLGNARWDCLECNKKGGSKK